MKESTRKIYDLTADITDKLVVFPGDPAFHTHELARINEASAFNLHQMTLCNHSGTHIDFPAHVIEGGKTSSDYGLEDLILDGQIVEVPESMNSISAAFVSSLQLNEGAAVFFKTRNSKLSKQDRLDQDYVYIEVDAAQCLVDKKVRVVGIDYLSVDNYIDSKLPVHHLLLSNDVLIVENLELAGVAAKHGKIFIMPLKVPGMDGLPVRVLLQGN